jgi:hypothetical protein
VSRELSQQEIDAVFQNKTDRKRDTPAVKFDFRRPDRIPKSQVRAIHLLHDTFVRNLVSSLSAYLRSYLTVNLVSVEQLSYAEFLDGLPSPTCIVSLGLEPLRRQRSAGTESLPGLSHPGNAAGRHREGSATIQRDITEIEQKLLDGLFRIILHDLAGGLEGRHGGGFHHRGDGDRAAVASPAGSQRSRGVDRRGSAHRRVRGDDEHRHALHRHQDDAAEVRPAMVGPQDSRQRRRTGARPAHAARGHARPWRPAWKAPR